MMTQIRPSATVVIPAHNEEAGLRRLLPQLLECAAPGEFRVLVICNGCTDKSADEARKYGPDIEVVELAAASKAAALQAGGVLARAFPLAYVDADVSLDARSLRVLVARVGRGGLLAVAPGRALKRDRVSLAARAYYDIWERLPQVRTGLFGRGVIVLSEAGYRRVADLPRFISDDLAYSESFPPGERTVVPEAIASIWPARTWRSLLKRRVRVVRGNQELDQTGRLSSAASTSVADLLRIVAREPLMALRLPVFLATTIIARGIAAREQPGGAVWLRDESSRVA